MQPLLIAVLLLQPCPQALIPGHEGIRCPVSPVAIETQTQEPTVSPVASDDDSDEDTDTDDDNTPDKHKTGGNHANTHKRVRLHGGSLQIRLSTPKGR